MEADIAELFCSLVANALDNSTDLAEMRLKLGRDERDRVTFSLGSLTKGTQNIGFIHKIFNFFKFFNIAPVNEMTASVPQP